MFDKLFFVILVLNATGLFRFVAPQLGTDIRTVSIALLILNMFYLMAKWKYISPLLNRPMMVFWLFVFLAWPLMTVLYAPEIMFRAIGIQFYIASLFCCSAVYVMANGLLSFHRIMSVSLLVSMFGIALSILAPGYFDSVSKLIDTKSDFGGRSFGFFMQPNMAATGICLLFIGWFSLLKRKNGLIEVGAIMALLAVILFTGSRTGAVISAMTVGLILLPSWKQHWSGGRYLMKVAVLAVCLTAGLILARGYVGSVGWVAKSQKQLFARVTNLLNFELVGGGGLSADSSVKSRLAAQQVYLSLIDESLLFGHGLGSEFYYQATGHIRLTSHSTALALALEYGVLYPVIFMFFMLRLWFNRNRSGVEGVFQTKSLLQFALVMSVMFIINGGLFDLRVFFVVWGMFFATVNYPRYLFNYDADGKIVSYKTRREILRGSLRNFIPRSTAGVSASTNYGAFRRGIGG